MAQRLKAIDLETGEPPALDQHEFEVDGEQKKFAIFPFLSKNQEPPNEKIFIFRFFSLI